MNDRESQYINSVQVSLFMCLFSHIPLLGAGVPLMHLQCQHSPGSYDQTARWLGSQ